MTEQYYRVKVAWPVPYCVRELFGEPTVATIMFDSRFYTTATTIRDVHLDIQAHLAKHYAEKGLNEAEDFDDLHLDLPDSEILQMYSRINQPASYEVEVIDDPEQVEFITRAIEQRELIKSIGQMLAMGFVPTPSTWKSQMHELGNHDFDLKRAIGGALRPFYHEDYLEVLKDVVEKGDVMIRELQIHAHSVIQKVKDV